MGEEELDFDSDVYCGVCGEEIEDCDCDDGVEL